jgi:hypothetical protein
MACNETHTMIVLAVYGELADDRLHQLQQHLHGCAACSEELEQLLAVKTLAAALPVNEPDANLVARSRMRLEEALDRLPPKRWYDRAAEWLTRSTAGMAAAPLAASLLLLTGIGSGILAGYHLAIRHVANAAMREEGVTPKPNEGESKSVANVAQIVEEPHSRLIDVSYSTVEPRHAQGTLDDPEIRDLLLFASQRAPSPEVRDRSIALLAAECSNGRDCSGAESEGSSLRDALMIALRYDGSVEVRRKALEGLKPYVGQDVQVRDALLESLLNDPDARIRSEAIAMLTPVDADTSVRQVLSTVAQRDDDSQVRNASKLMLERVSEVQ